MPESSQPIEFVISASIGALLVVAVAVLRIYLGWAYVGDRLLSAAVEYEETGWYDGQVRARGRARKPGKRCCCGHMMPISRHVLRCVPGTTMSTSGSGAGVCEAAADPGTRQAPRTLRGAQRSHPDLQPGLPELFCWCLGCSGCAASSTCIKKPVCSRAQVQPVLQRLKTTLTGSGAALLMSSVLLFGLIRAGTDADGMYGELALPMPQVATESQCGLQVVTSRTNRKVVTVSSYMWRGCHDFVSICPSAASPWWQAVAPSAHVSAALMASSTRRWCVICQTCGTTMMRPLQSRQRRCAGTTAPAIA